MSHLLNNQSIKVELAPGLKNQLKYLALQMERKQNDLMKQKLQREQQKQNKLKQIQTNYNKWVESKSDMYQNKLQKVQKNKQTQIAKVIKRCKDRDKYVSKKQQDCKKTHKKSLNVAWKKAQQFNDNIQSYYKSKYIFNRTAKDGHSGNTFHVSSTQHEDATEQQRHERSTDPTNVKVMNNTSSNLYSPGKIIQSQSQNNKITKFYEVANSKQNVAKPQKQQYMYSSVTQTNLDKQKGLDILLKMKNQNQLNEQIRIQQLGEKFQRIQQTRFRRIKNHEKKTTQKSTQQRQRNFTAVDFSNKKSPKSKSKKQEDRMHSEQSYKRQARVKDRTMQAKIKREQMFEQHLAEGQQYLQNIKIRHLKNVIAKNIAYNALQKKLYQERLNS